MATRRFPTVSFRALLAWLLTAPVAFASTSVHEAEPNNTPAAATAITGAVTLLGALPQTDQDGYLWTVSDDDARKRWTFELHGIPGALTITEIVRVEYADNGVDVLRTHRLLKMGTRDGLTPAIAANLLFEPGEYLVGIARSGGGGPFRPPTTAVAFGTSGTPEHTTDAARASGTGLAASAETDLSAYRLIIREGKRLSVKSDPGVHETRQQALPLRPGQAFAAFETREAAWYAFRFDEQDAARRWDIAMQVPLGRTLQATLYDAAGERLASTIADPRGHLSFPDLAPDATTYHVELSAKEAGFIRAIGSEAVGQRVSGEEAEPNGEWQLANRVDLSVPLRGRVGVKHESDYFRFNVDESGSDQLLELKIEATVPGRSLELCLLDADGARIQCRNGKTPFALPDLLLAPGDWGLSVKRADEGEEYRITLSALGAIGPGMEAEPNDSIQLASGVPSNNRVKGRIIGEDDDFFRFTVTGEPALWRFQVMGADLFEVEYQDVAGRQKSRVRPKRGQTRVRLDNLYLMPGQHFLRVSGKADADYTLLARAIGAPDPDGEREPNDDESRMQRLAFGQTRTGLMSDLDDRDLYRFFLAHWDHIRLTVQPPPDGVVEPQLYWYGRSLGTGIRGKAGDPVTLAGVFPPGDYHVALGAKQVSDAEYRLGLERLPRFSCVRDCEPSGLSDLYVASPLPTDLVIEGRAGEWRDVDTYQLPDSSTAAALEIRSTKAVRLSLGVNRFTSELLNYDAASGTYRTTVPAGGPYQLIVDAEGQDYRLELAFENGPPPKINGPLPAAVILTFDASKVSAYRTQGQELAGRLDFDNRSTVPLAVRLEAVASDYRWRVTLERDAISVAPGARVSVPVAVRVPRDAWAERPVRISVRAYDEDGAQIETWQEIDVDRDAAMVGPTLGWDIPDALRGGFNAAWAPFGGDWSDGLPKGTRYEKLRDGLVFDGITVECCAGTYGWPADYRPELTLRLPGEAPLPIAGIALDHFGSGNPLTLIRRGTLLLSQDGTTFEAALSFETLPVRTEQYFALAEPVMARFARLRVDATFDVRPGQGGVTGGEWKVITRPGFDLSGGNGFNLADPALGGHVVSDWPPQGYSPTGVVDLEDKGHTVRLKPGETQDYVIGFHHNRAARIHRLEWVYTDDVDDEDKFDRVAIAVSTEAAVGPWRPLGEIPLANAGTAVFDLGTGTWARFVKLSAIPKKISGTSAAPATIRIREQPTSRDYRSVLTEWGHASRRGFYEDQAGLAPEPELAAAENDVRQRAALLAPGQRATGQVALSKHEHWYRMQVPDGQNALTIAITGDPTVRAGVMLEAASGEPIPLRKNLRDSTPRQHRFDAVVEPGALVYFRIAEPPRNVVFAWDTSASINRYLPTIYNALGAFASQVVPGQEAVNLLPFNSPPLLRDWYGEPYVLQTILNDFPHTLGSSSAEKTLQDSAELLAPLAGSKAIVVITDGITVHHGPMWQAMREVQPTIFGIGVGGLEAWNVDVFEDWASVNGGHYRHLNYAGEMEVAFDRAATLLRRPADYGLRVTSEYREAPGPGTLTVESGSVAAGSSAAIALILDASGSMLQRLDGTRRIAIAKEVLTEAVTRQIPPGTPVALRVFGHKAPDACRTDLELPLSPLNPATAAKAIAAVEAMNLARTPIADSLAAVAGDLGDSKDRAVIVLVTDGEETCGGDPGKVIESLAARGIEVSLNIVGFAIDDPALSDQFARWAEQGNGRYFPAGNRAGLSRALEDALRIPYTVLDRAGNLLAEGTVDGAPVELAQGTYRVVVRSAQPRIFEDVEVQGGEHASLALD